MPDRDIERVLIPAERIRARVEELAEEIRETLAPGPVCAVGVLTGAFVFLSDLVRALPIPVEVSFLRARSYGEGSRPGELSLSWVAEPDLEGRDVLVVEDILDTGRSLRAILEEIRERGARSVRTAVLLDKRDRREVSVSADFTGFEVPDEFLVGYGLDFAGRYRALPYVGVLKREVYGERG